MGYPEPANRQRVPILVPADEPDCSARHPATNPHAEVLRNDGEWQPCEVLAWARVSPFIQWATGEPVSWLVQLRIAAGDEGWYEHVPGCLRPASAEHPL